MNLQNNAIVLQKETQWLQSVIHQRIRNTGNKEFSIYDSRQPELDSAPTAYSDFIKKCNLSFDERALLILALVPHIDPTLLSHYSSDKFNLEDRYIFLLGSSGHNYKGLLPTGLTFLFLMAGSNMNLRLKLQHLLSSRNVLAEHNVVSLEPHYKGEPCFSGKIMMSESFVELFTIGEVNKKDSIKYSFNKESL